MMATGLILIALAGAAFFIWRPTFAGKGAEGRILAFGALLVLPVLAGFAGLSVHLDASKKTSYCVSCHAMSPYERTLHVDDPSHLAANHFQNARIPRDQACYACHTDYSFYGDLNDKIRGGRHVLTQYLFTPPRHIKLYKPYNNRECLHCHAGARSFEEAATHRLEPDRLQRLRDNKESCLSSGCHNVVHDVDHLAGAAAWRQP